MTNREMKRFKKMIKNGKVSFKHNAISTKITSPDDLYAVATVLMGLKDSAPNSRKMTNGKETVNVVKWGQDISWKEWYITDKVKNNLTYVIIDDEVEEGEWIDMNKVTGVLSTLLNISCELAAPQFNNWSWV